MTTWTKARAKSVSYIHLTIKERRRKDARGKNMMAKGVEESLSEEGML